MPLRTRVVAGLLDLLDRGPVDERTPRQLARSRRLRAPEHWPFDRVFGVTPAGTVRRDEHLPGPAGAPLRVHVVEQAGRRRPSPLVVWFHGGGWVQGGVERYDPLCAQLAARTGALVASVDYRMAPEHPFPAAVEDVVAATRWLVDEAARLGVDPARVAVAGDSAGGNLAAVVCQQLQGDGPRIAFQALLYPALDATLASPSMQRNADAPVLSLRRVREFLGLYLQDGDPTDPRISPLLAPSLAGLPPALVQTAQLDPLADDGVRYAAALTAAAVPVRHTQYVDTPHGYLSFPGAVPCGRQALAELVGALRGAFR